jgi:NTP pyrophosphatase (non-canonical NTP hydrolase)
MTSPVTSDIAAFQQQMVTLYGQRDAERGLARTFAWLAEEVGELSHARFRGSHEDRDQIPSASLRCPSEAHSKFGHR